MRTCDTCRYWRRQDDAKAAKPPKHPRGRCGSLDERVPVGPEHHALTTFADFGCIAHEAAAGKPTSH